MGNAADRRQEILAAIAAAAALAKRDPADVQLIAVSKGRSAEEIQALIEAGQRDFGENRVQEALAKWPPLLALYPGVRVHEIGRLQSNKAVDAVQLFDTIHSVDRRLVARSVGESAGTAPSVYIQVNIGEEEQKGGCAITEIGALVEPFARRHCRSPD